MIRAELTAPPPAPDGAPLILLRYAADAMQRARWRPRRRRQMPAAASRRRPDYAAAAAASAADAAPMAPRYAIQAQPLQDVALIIFITPAAAALTDSHAGSLIRPFFAFTPAG